MKMGLVVGVHVGGGVGDDIEHARSILLFKFELSISAATLARVFASALVGDRCTARLALAATERTRVVPLLC